jgi:uncharacterized membrane-anchored protein
MSLFARIFIALLLLGISTSGSHAKSYKELFPDRVYKNSEAQAFVESLNYQQGTVLIGAANVRLTVPNGFYFLGADDSRRVLVDLWSNPSTVAQNALGMIFPAGETPVDDVWGAIISFDADGYVSDEDAASIDYVSLLKSMQAGEAEVNKERVQQGFPEIHLVGWAAQPFYDRTTRKLHWAKEFQFGSDPNHTLNYDIRVLGRSGVLKINFVSGIGQLAAINGIIPTVMGMPEFEPGSRYQDFIPSTDKLAAYGIGGLIAGKVLSKAGFLALAAVFLKKFGVFILLAFGGLLAGIKRMFTGK